MNPDTVSRIRAGRIIQIHDYLCSKSGYERSTLGTMVTDPMTKLPYISKGPILVKLDESASLTRPNAQNYCEMTIKASVDDFPALPLHLSHQFSKMQSRGSKFLQRLFTYDAMQGYECMHPARSLHIADIEEAAKAIDKEVNITTSMLESLKHA